MYRSQVFSSTALSTCLLFHYFPRLLLYYSPFLSPLPSMHHLASASGADGSSPSTLSIHHCVSSHPYHRTFHTFNGADSKLKSAMTPLTMRFYIMDSCLLPIPLTGKNYALRQGLQVVIVWRRVGRINWNEGGSPVKSDR